MQTKPDYGIDAPTVFRNLWIGAILCLATAPFLPPMVHLGSNFAINLRATLLITGTVCLIEAILFTVYVKYGKFKHRDFMLAMHPWTGDEQVLDVGCGRGLLLAGAAKRLTTGHATGIDVWSNVDMGGNSAGATEHNLQMEGIEDICSLLSVPAQDMTFADGSFDVILSNLCIHNIYDKPTRGNALKQIARVLKPGGVAIISDFKHTGEYATAFTAAGLNVSQSSGAVF